jgi:DNA mismatch repair protein MutL
MPNRVHVLPDEIANQIAAGEVVERPASVVKELVENSVDACASKVSVRVEGSGRRLICVEDDGYGMGREDAFLALERHATSKITSAEDLERIGTLGFRGEALPSIASVSRLSLTTRAGESPEGTRLRLEGGKLLGVESVGAPRGTSVEVRDLFFNTPARQKFLRGDATELRNVVEVLTSLALVHPSVGFELRSSGRILLALPSGLGLEERAAELLPAEAPGGLFWRRFEAPGALLTLGLGAPEWGRNPRKGVRLFVNRRPVQDRLLFRAIMEGLKSAAGPGREPRALLWLELSPGEVDVNVHPAKREVRFSDESRVFRWVLGSAAEAVSQAPWAGVLRSHGEPPTVRRFRIPPTDAEPTSRALGRVAEALEGYTRRSSAGAGPPRPIDLSSPSFAAPSARAPALHQAPLLAAAERLRPLGCFDATYLLFEDSAARELVLIDQHAAHERALFETLLGRGGATLRRQALLFPLVLECTAAEMAAFEELAGDLDSLGFRAEPFGQLSLAVTEAPADVPSTAAEAMFREMLQPEDPLPEGAPLSRREALAARAACSGAVKARKALVASEVEALLRRLDELPVSASCPHGRPTALRLSRADLERMFHRK